MAAIFPKCSVCGLSIYQAYDGSWYHRHDHATVAAASAKRGADWKHRAEPQ